MSLSPREYILHILDEIDYILTQISDTDFDAFLKDDTLKSSSFPAIHYARWVCAYPASRLPGKCR